MTVGSKKNHKNFFLSYFYSFKTMNGYTKGSDLFSTTIRHAKVTSKDPAKFLCSCGKNYNIQDSLKKHVYRSRHL